MTRTLSSLLVALILMAPLAVNAQEDVTSPAPSADKVKSNVDSLDALLQSISSKEGEIRKLQVQLKTAPDEITRAELLDDLRELKSEAEELNRQFRTFATSVDISVFSEEPSTKFDWQEELGGLLRPIIAELKSATAESRAVGELRNQIEDLDTLQEVAREGVSNLETLLAANPPPELRTRLETEVATWKQRLDDVSNQRTALNLQLENRLAERESALTEATGYAQEFFSTRGMNLLWGLVAFCGVFFGVRFLAAALRKLRSSSKEKSFTSRITALLLHLFSILGGLVATLLVFNMAGDWFLLGIIIIFLLGVAWAGVKTLPQYVETAKLMLNIGAVKEGERLVFQGTPWKVDTLGFAAKLVNPLLDGGVQTMPVKYLVGMHSRPNGEREEWFPCRPGDWVELSDGRTGHVSYQTPSTVQLVELGGSQVVYQTSDFLAQSPKVLSTNFRITTSFGVDYKHQAICTTEIPEKMQAALVKGLAEVVDAKHLKHVGVSFTEAAASSLDYAIDVDLDGAAASKRLNVERAVARILVEACNDHGWEIPFTQVTMHQA